MSKTTPIPIRFDDDVDTLITRLSETTGLTKVEIVRRCVRYSLDEAREQGSIEFLLANRDKISAVLAEDPKAYRTKKEKP